jgi:ATP-binding cassette subfamily B protein
VAAVELVGAVVALANGSSPRQHVTLLGLAVGGVGVGAAGHSRAHRACAAARLEVTERLVEALAGHRTRLALGVAEPDPREDAALAGYHALTSRLGRTEMWLLAGLPRAWVLAGLGALAVTSAARAVEPGSLAASLGGVLLARAGLGRMAWAVTGLSAGRSAAAEVRPIVCPRVGCSTAGRATRPRAAPPGESLTSNLLLEAQGLESLPAGRRKSVLTAAGIELRAGERVLIDGASGAGKSTLAAILAGLRRPDAGLLLLWGLDLATWGVEGWRRRVVAVPQLHENHLFAETLAFNLLLGRAWPPAPADLADAERVCDELGLGALLDRLPAGIEQRIGEAGWQLSDGEASRVCLARALLQQPDLLILDESLAALDPETRRQVLEAVGRHARTVVLIAHGQWGSALTGGRSGA